MSKRFHCTCGTTINAPDSATSARCPECEATIFEDGFEEESTKQTSRSKKKKKQASKTKSDQIAAVDASESSAFEPNAGQMPVMKTRRVKRRKEPAPNTEKADINPFPVWLLAWIDPALLLWMPLLGPSLAFTFGTILFGLLLIPFGGGMLALPGALFGGFLTCMPAALTVYHWCEVLGEWSRGADRDPEWPTMDAFEMIRRLCQWIGSAVIAGAVGYGVYRGLHWLSGKQPWISIGATYSVAFFVGFVYFPIALLAAVLSDSLLLANPLVVGMALFRLRKGAVAFWFEYAAHLAIHAMCLYWILNIKRHSLAAGLLAWILWWCLVLLSTSRQMRILGRFYFRNQKRVGWFA